MIGCWKDARVLLSPVRHNSDKQQLQKSNNVQDGIGSQQPLWPEISDKSIDYRVSRVRDANNGYF